jgi:hypothetical protein
MRVNIYNEELTDEVAVFAKRTETGLNYYGLRFVLKSSEALHHTKADDDRSAVTFYFGHDRKSQIQILDLLMDAANQVRDVIDADDERAMRQLGSLDYGKLVEEGRMWGALPVGAEPTEGLFAQEGGAITHPDRVLLLCKCGRSREAHPVDTLTYHCGRFEPTWEQTISGPQPEDAGSE